MKTIMLGVTVVAALAAQQVPDTEFRPPIAKPAYAPGKGPVVLIDEAHFNFHTAAGRYLPFAELLRRDGYVVQASAKAFSAEALRSGKVLVIANALNEKNKSDWNLPHPPAFSVEEVAAVRKWVSGGGALLLIADHPPFSGAAEDLGKAFGIRFRNAVAMNTKEKSSRLVFRRADATLADHPVTKDISSVATFTGSSFQLDVPGIPLLVFGPDVYSVTRQDDPNAQPLKGHLQGALVTHGKGRVAVFGEAAMFSAQLAGPNKMPMGMNAESAKENPRLVLNVMHWLSRAK